MSFSIRLFLLQVNNINNNNNNLSVFCELINGVHLGCRYYTRLFWSMFTSVYSSALLGAWPWSWMTEVGRLFSCLGE